MMQTDQKIDDKALAVIASRFKMDGREEQAAANKAFSGKALTNAERNLLIKHIETKQFAAKPMSMAEMKRAILTKIGSKNIERNAYAYGVAQPSNTVSRGELEEIYNYVVKGSKPDKVEEDEEE